jgi:hypothetical protein
MVARQSLANIMRLSGINCARALFLQGVDRGIF